MAPTWEAEVLAAIFAGETSHINLNRQYAPASVRFAPSWTDESARNKLLHSTYHFMMQHGTRVETALTLMSHYPAPPHPIILRHICRQALRIVC